MNTDAYISDREREVRKHPWHVVLAPGCHREVEAPVVSRHRSIAAALRSARRSDRFQVESARVDRTLGWCGDRREGDPWGREGSSLAEVRNEALAAGIDPDTGRWIMPFG